MAWKDIFDKSKLTFLTQPLSEHLEKHGPTTYEEAMRYDYQSALLSNIKNLNMLLAQHLDILIKKFVELYRPAGRYIASFSKNGNNALMWSHYASKHKGFCLIFKAIDGHLKQDKKRQIKIIRKKTPSGIASSSGYAIPEHFTFSDINYCSDIQMIDASRFMPKHIYGTEITEAERLNILNENNKKHLEKHDCWKYEEESRLFLDRPIPWLFGEHFDYTPEERLLHYQPTQLVGIILGALMEQHTKDRIHEIISNRMERIMHTGSCAGNALFKFVLFEAYLSDRKRGVEILPKDIWDGTTITSKDKSPMRCTKPSNLILSLKEHLKCNPRKTIWKVRAEEF